MTDNATALVEQILRRNGMGSDSLGAAVAIVSSLRALPPADRMKAMRVFSCVHCAAAFEPSDPGSVCYCSPACMKAAISEVEA